MCIYAEYADMRIEKMWRMANPNWHTLLNIFYPFDLKLSGETSHSLTQYVRVKHVRNVGE